MRFSAESESMRIIALRGRMYYTVENHVRHLGEAKAGEPLYVTVQLLERRMISACTCSSACIGAATTG